MHAHHKNLLRDFWLISLGKTPTGKTSQRGEILINFFSNVQDRKIVENTTYLHRQTSSQSQENLCSANQPTPFFFSCAKSDANVQHQQAVHLPRKQCQQSGRTTAKTGRTSSSKFMPKCRSYTDKPGRTFLEKRAAINEPVPTGRTSNFWAFNADCTVQ